MNNCKILILIALILECLSNSQNGLHKTLLISKKAHSSKVSKAHAKKSEKSKRAEKEQSESETNAGKEGKDSEVEKVEAIYKDLSEECRDEVNILCRNNMRCGRPTKNKRGPTICCLGINDKCNEDGDCCYGSTCMGSCYPASFPVGHGCNNDEECYNDFRCCAGTCCKAVNCLRQARGTSIQETCLGSFPSFF